MEPWVWVASTVIPALLLNECGELSPWLARRIVKSGAHLLLERNQVTRYQEEWLAGLDETPGKLTVLIRALGIVLIAVPRMNWDYLDCIWSCTIGRRPSTTTGASPRRGPRLLQLSEQHRAEAHRFNTSLRAACHLLRRGSPTERAEAFDLLEYLIENPPPWVANHQLRALSLKWMTGRDLPHFRQSLRRRGLLEDAS
jgi:hypothetical protein